MAKIISKKRHTHRCYQCRQAVSCYLIHLKDKSDVLAMLCDHCIRKIVADMHSLNV